MAGGVLGALTNKSFGLAFACFASLPRCLYAIFVTQYSGMSVKELKR